MSSKFEIETLKIVLTNFMVIIKGMYWNVYGIRLLLSHKIYFVIACWRPAVRSGNVSINTKVIAVNQMINKPCQIYSGAKITKQWILELRSNISSLLPKINPVRQDWSNNKEHSFSIVNILVTMEKAQTI